MQTVLGILNYWHDCLTFENEDHCGNVSPTRKLPKEVHEQKDFIIQQLCAAVL